jgi:hypothetical protein
MTNIFKSPGVYTTERNSDYWLPPELMKGLKQSGLSMTRRMKISKIFKDESLYPVMKDGPIGITGTLGHPGVSGTSE